MITVVKMESFSVTIQPFKSEQFNEKSLNYDALILIATNDSFKSGCCSGFMKHVIEYQAFDKTAEKEECLFVLPEGNPIRRLIHSPVVLINKDKDDVRLFRDAAYRGVKRALAAGASKLLIALPDVTNLRETNCNEYVYAEGVAVLGALEALYVPLEIREAIPEKASKVEHISFCCSSDDHLFAQAVESGIVVARDIAGSDPERMSPPKVVEFVTNLFTGTSISVKVIDNQDEINTEFPCLGAVNRGSPEKHKGRVIFLSYEPKSGTIERTLILVGKGVCYDTGGHDIKDGGRMAGMHRDKCGAAAVAGFLKTVDKLQPKGIRVIAAMVMVRNSIGPNAYVADELIKTRSGMRLRVRNTDTEGRMAMVDVLCYLKEQALQKNYLNPTFFTIATLTSHAELTVGNYSVILDNGPAKKNKVSFLIQEAGSKIGDLFEVSTIRKEDYEFNKGKSEYEDVNQSPAIASSRVMRGHQIPAAFLVTVSGLDKHDLDSDKPFPYCHIDIAGSSGSFPGVPTGAPIAALSMAYLKSD